jgi:transcription-repair coupling factor (superfamily II helicase)
VFDHVCCLILENNKVIYTENRKGNVNKIKTNACMRIKSCLITNIKDNFLWYRRLSHINMDILSKLIKNELVKGFSHIDFKKKKLCDTC